MARRRKKADAVDAGAVSNLEDTRRRQELPTGDDGDERWSGDPDEPVPYAGKPANDPEPAAEQDTSPESKGAYTQALTEEFSDAQADTAQGLPTPPTPPSPWGSIIHGVFDLDVEATYQRLAAELSLGTAATEYGKVLAALDKSARNAFDAARLARKAKLEDQQYGSELDKELEVLRSAAQAALEEEKAKGLRSKAPTIDDIKGRMLASWPDKVGRISRRKEEMHGAYRSIEALAEAWRERCQVLRTMAQGFRASGTT